MGPPSAVPERLFSQSQHHERHSPAGSHRPTQVEEDISNRLPIFIVDQSPHHYFREDSQYKGEGKEDEDDMHHVNGTLEHIFHLAIGTRLKLFEALF